MKITMKWTAGIALNLVLVLISLATCLPAWAFERSTLAVIRLAQKGYDFGRRPS